MDKDHAFRRFNRELKEDRLSRLLLLYGEEQLQVDWAVKEIMDKYVNNASQSLDVNTFDGLPDLEELIEALETLTMISEKRVVIVNDSKIFNALKQPQCFLLCLNTYFCAPYSFFTCFKRKVTGYFCGLYNSC